MTPAQRDALAEAYEIQWASEGSFAVVAHRDEDGWLEIDVRLDARPFVTQHRAEGLLFEPEEQVRITLPPTFPVGYPLASVDHTRFAGYENVLRGDGLCLFRSPSTDWTPETGLTGFVRDRLWTWFDRVSRGELEQQGGGFHAPVLNHVAPVPASVVLVAPEPQVARPWLGFTRLRLRDRPEVQSSRPVPYRADLVGWADTTRQHVAGQQFGAAVLVDNRLGFEFPGTLGALLRSLGGAGIAPAALVEHLGRAAQAEGRGGLLFLTVGTPMGPSDPRHFLTTLLLEPTATAAVWEAGGTRLKAQAVERVLSSADQTALYVCGAHEARPTVAVRRDAGAPMAWFEGRTVAVWGCGALGGPVALAIARAGASRLILRDRGVVSPGLLARQPYTDADVDVFKVDALRHQLQAIRPGLKVIPHVGDITRLAASADWTDGADLVVNATASPAVRVLLDLRRGAGGLPRTPVFTLGVDGRAERAFARLLGTDAEGGVGDLEREVKLALTARPDADHFVGAFFPPPGPSETKPFYPEPGCSESTFVGSSADMSALASSSLNWAAHRLAAAPGGAAAVLLAHPHVAIIGGVLPHVEVIPAPRFWTTDPRSGYTVTFIPNVREQVVQMVDDAQARLGPTVETGGPLYGAWDSVRRIVWIDRAGPPPPDSIEAVDRFVCGVVGLAEETARLADTTRGATGFVGTWHTHPRHPPDPSSRDLASLADVFARPETLPRVFTMLIVGSPHTTPDFRPHVYYKSDFKAVNSEASTE